MPEKSLRATVKRGEICKCEIKTGTHFDIAVWNNDREQTEA